MDTLNPYLLLTLAFFAGTLYLLLQPHPTTDLARWLQKKNYQYEVTSSLYMLTPTEKFVFSAFPPISLANKLSDEQVWLAGREGRRVGRVCVLC